MASANEITATVKTNGGITKHDIFRKLTSRKFWALIAEFVVALLIAFRYDATEAERIGALIMLGAAPIAYMFAEGWADSNRDYGEVTYYVDDDKPPEQNAEQG